MRAFFPRTTFARAARILAPLLSIVLSSSVIAQDITNETSRGTVTITVENARKTLGVRQERAPEGKIFLVTTILLENTSDYSAVYNGDYFKVRDNADNEYDPMPTHTRRTLKSGKLAKGEKTVGRLVFEVPLDAAGLSLEYTPIARFGANAEVITIKLDIEDPLPKKPVEKSPAK